MKFWDRLKFWADDWKIITSIEVEYSFYTNSGYNVFTTEDKIKHKATSVYKNANTIYWDKTREFEKTNTKLFNKIAYDDLKSNRKQKKIELCDGVVIPGDYIVKSSWEVYLRYRDATFEEYMRLKHG